MFFCLLRRLYILFLFFPYGFVVTIIVVAAVVVGVAAADHLAPPVGVRLFYATTKIMELVITINKILAAQFFKRRFH